MIEGTEQRVYGVLIGDCYFDLRRIALVIDSEIDDPIVASTVYYGNDETYTRIKNCGNLYKGYLSILFSLVNNFDNPIAVAEIRKCATGRSYIFIESYGIATTTTPISLWFNQGTINIPDWIKLNSTPSDVMSYSESSFKFSEKKTGEVIEISGCRKCDGNSCLSCAVLFRFFGFTTYGFNTYDYNTRVDPDRGTCPHVGIGYHKINYGYRGYGTNSILLDSNGEYSETGRCWDLIVEYTLECDKIKIWYYTEGLIRQLDEHGLTFYKNIDDTIGTTLLYYVYGDVPVTYTELPFDYLESCATNSISISGCTTLTIPYPTTPDEWNKYYTAEFITTPSSSPINKCFPTTYTDFTWDLNYNASPSYPVEGVGKTVTHDYSYIAPELYKDNYLSHYFPFIFQTQHYNVYVKTEDLYTSKTPKYIEKINNNCINLSISLSCIITNFSGVYEDTLVAYGPNGFVCLETSSNNVIDASWFIKTGCGVSSGGSNIIGDSNCIYRSSGGSSTANVLNSNKLGYITQSRTDTNEYTGNYVKLSCGYLGRYCKVSNGLDTQYGYMDTTVVPPVWHSAGTWFDDYDQYIKYFTVLGHTPWNNMTWAIGHPASYIVTYQSNILYGYDLFPDNSFVVPSSQRILIYLNGSSEEIAVINSSAYGSGNILLNAIKIDENTVWILPDPGGLSNYGIAYKLTFGSNSVTSTQVNPNISLSRWNATSDHICYYNGYYYCVEDIVDAYGNVQYIGIFSSPDMATWALMHSVTSTSELNQGYCTICGYNNKIWVIQMPRIYLFDAL
jgi:hypothetical protein